MEKTFVNADHVIGHMHSTIEGATAIIDTVEAEYFGGEPTKEAVEKLTIEYNKVGKLLRAALELLNTAEEENLKWQHRPAEQVKGEQEA